jgi:hypothetical protein
MQKFKEMGLPVNAGQIIDVPVENIPTQRVYSENKQDTEQESQQYSQNKESFDTTTNENIMSAIQTQLAEERSKRQSILHTAPKERLNALEAIRRGAKKQEFSTFIKVESNSGKGNQLPEPKIGRKKEKIEQSVPLESLPKAQKNSEAEMLEACFTEKPGLIDIPSSKMSTSNETLIQADENYSNFGPSFNPLEQLRKRAEERGVSLDFNKEKQIVPESNKTLRENNNGDQLQKLMLTVESLLKNQQKNYDLEMLKEIMSNIAKKVAEETIAKILKEYVESQKRKNVFEVANKEKNIIKISDKYYQLKPVTIKHNNT